MSKQSKIKLRQYKFLCKHSALNIIQKFLYRNQIISEYGASALPLVAKELKICNRGQVKLYAPPSYVNPLSSSPGRRRFILNRHELKKLSTKGLVPYLKRGSW